MDIGYYISRVSALEKQIDRLYEREALHTEAEGMLARERDTARAQVAALRGAAKDARSVLRLADRSDAWKAERDRVVGVLDEALQSGGGNTNYEGRAVACDRAREPVTGEESAEVPADHGHGAKHAGSTPVAPHQSLSFGDPHPCDVATAQEYGDPFEGRFMPGVNVSDEGTTAGGGEPDFDAWLANIPRGPEGWDGLTALDLRDLWRRLPVNSGVSGPGAAECAECRHSPLNQNCSEER